MSFSVGDVRPRRTCDWCGELIWPAQPVGEHRGRVYHQECWDHAEHEAYEDEDYRDPMDDPYVRYGVSKADFF